MYSEIFTAVWEMFQNEITVNGFTFTYAQFFIFDFFCIVLARFIVILLNIKG